MGYWISSMDETNWGSKRTLQGSRLWLTSFIWGDTSLSLSLSLSLFMQQETYNYLSSSLVSNKGFLFCLDHEWWQRFSCKLVVVPFTLKKKIILSWRNFLNQEVHFRYSICTVYSCTCVDAYIFTWYQNLDKSFSLWKTLFWSLERLGFIIF